ncbi:MAG: type II toxin-antitoxin system HicB family antitoxin [Desulfococcaceae bacterium]
MKFWYAIFTKSKNAVEVEFPDLPGCLTFGDTYTIT